MGNEQTVPLPGEPAPRDVVRNLMRGTPFTFMEADLIMRRYNTMDQSPDGKRGIPVDDVIMMPEFTACIFAPDIIRYHKHKESKKIHPREFMKICSLFCSRTPALKKKQFLFDLFDVDKQKVLGHDAMYRLFKLILSNTVSDDQILALTFSALRHPNLEKDDEVTREEFVNMIGDNEIQERLSIDMAYDPSVHQVVPAGGEEDEEDDEEDA